MCAEHEHRARMGHVGPWGVDVGVAKIACVILHSDGGGGAKQQGPEAQGCD